MSLESHSANRRLPPIKEPGTGSRGASYTRQPATPMMILPDYYYWYLTALLHPISSKNTSTRQPQSTEHEKTQRQSRCFHPFDNVRRDPQVR